MKKPTHCEHCGEKFQRDVITAVLIMTGEVICMRCYQDLRTRQTKRAS